MFEVTVSLNGLEISKLVTLAATKSVLTKQAKKNIYQSLSGDALKVAKYIGGDIKNASPFVISAAKLILEWQSLDSQKRNNTSTVDNLNQSP